MATPVMRGNTFLTFLLRSGCQELSARTKWDAPPNGKTRPKMFAALMRMTFPAYRPEMDTLASYFSRYLDGSVPKSPTCYAFDTPVIQGGLASRIKNEYRGVLAEMDRFCDTFLAKDDYSLCLLVAGIVDTILADDTFTGEFDVGRRKIGKSDLKEQRSFILQPFLLSVWSNILVNHPDTSEGADTYAEWTKASGKHTARNITTAIGAERAEKIVVSTDLTEVLEMEMVTKEDQAEAVILEPVPENSDDSKEHPVIGHNGRIYNQYAQKIVNIEHVDTLQI